MKKYQLTSQVRGVGTAMIVFGILGGISALLRAADFPEVARSNAIVGAILLVLGLGLRARKQWAWWGLTILASASVAVALVFIVYSLVTGKTETTIFVVFAAAIWGLVLWLLLRGRRRVPSGADPTPDSGF